MDNNNKINGIDVSESVSTATNNDVYYSQKAVDELQNKIERLQEENEKIKKQYNCYACGNCNGKEDYINLEKHHKGLRKQFDELVKRNNTLSLRIEEIENEKEKIEEDAEYFLNGDYCDEKCNSAKNELKYKQALKEIRENILSKYSIDENKTIIANPLEDLWCIKKLIDEALNDRN